MSFLLIILIPARILAQTDARDIHFRIGSGSIMTPPGSRSFLISLPSENLTFYNGFPIIYLDKSVALSDERKKLDFIVGVCPMVRFDLIRGTSTFLVEAGVGANLVSSREMGGRQLGSNFLFSPTLSAGIEVPWTNGLLGVFYVFRHLSNAGFFEDNQGINFQYIVFSMSFRDL